MILVPGGGMKSNSPFATGTLTTGSEVEVAPVALGAEDERAADLVGSGVDVEEHLLQAGVASLGCSSST